MGDQQRQQGQLQHYIPVAHAPPDHGPSAPPADSQHQEVKKLPTLAQWRKSNNKPAPNMLFRPDPEGNQANGAILGVIVLGVAGVVGVVGYYMLAAKSRVLHQAAIGAGVSIFVILLLAAWAMTRDTVEIRQKNEKLTAMVKEEERVSLINRRPKIGVSAATFCQALGFSAVLFDTGYTVDGLLGGGAIKTGSILFLAILAGGLIFSGALMDKVYQQEVNAHLRDTDSLKTTTESALQESLQKTTLTPAADFSDTLDKEKSQSTLKNLFYKDTATMIRTGLILGGIGATLWVASATDANTVLRFGFVLGIALIAFAAWEIFRAAKTMKQNEAQVANLNSRTVNSQNNIQSMYGKTIGFFGFSKPAVVATVGMVPLLGAIGVGVWATQGGRGIGGWVVTMGLAGCLAMYFAASLFKSRQDGISEAIKTARLA